MKLEQCSGGEIRVAAQSGSECESNSSNSWFDRSVGWNLWTQFSSHRLVSQSHSVQLLLKCLYWWIQYVYIHSAMLMLLPLPYCYFQNMTTIQLISQWVCVTVMAWWIGWSDHVNRTKWSSVHVPLRCTSFFLLGNIRKVSKLPRMIA